MFLNFSNCGCVCLFNLDEAGLIVGSLIYLIGSNCEKLMCNELEFNFVFGIVNVVSMFRHEPGILFWFVVFNDVKLDEA